MILKKCLVFFSENFQVSSTKYSCETKIMLQKTNFSTKIYSCLILNQFRHKFRQSHDFNEWK